MLQLIGTIDSDMMAWSYKALIINVILKADNKLNNIDRWIIMFQDICTILYSTVPASASHDREI